jgi:DNA-binding NarL/FixJ family response regulator
MALEQLVREAGCRVAVSDDPFGTAIDGAPRSGGPVPILLGLGARDFANGTVGYVLRSYDDHPIVIFLREECRGRLPERLPDCVLAVITSGMSTAVALAMMKVAASGQRIVGQETAAEARRTGQGDGPRVLTPREAEITREVCRGVSDKEIARKLGIAVNTVNVHLSSIRRKLGVSNRTQLALRLSGGGGQPRGGLSDAGARAHP